MTLPSDRIIKNSLRIALVQEGRSPGLGGDGTHNELEGIGTGLPSAVMVKPAGQTQRLHVLTLAVTSQWPRWHRGRKLTTILTAASTMGGMVEGWGTREPALPSFPFLPLTQGWAEPGKEEL